MIQPGDSIPLAIENGLESSRTLVLVMSEAAFDPEWVTLERHVALFREPTNQQRRFIPLRLDDCDIKASLKQFTYVDWREKDEEEYSKLQQAVQEDRHMATTISNPVLVFAAPELTENCFFHQRFGSRSSIRLILRFYLLPTTFDLEIRNARQLIPWGTPVIGYTKSHFLTRELKLAHFN